LRRGRGGKIGGSGKERGGEKGDGEGGGCVRRG